MADDYFKHMDESVAKVIEDHEMREDRCETLPLQHRPFKRRPRPKTAIISRAAMDAIARREWVEELVCPETNHISTGLTELLEKARG